MKKINLKTLFLFAMTSVMLFAMSICVCAAPTGLKQVATDKMGFAVEWTDTSGSEDTYYSMQVAKDAAFSNVVKQVYKKGTSILAVLGLDAGSSYYVRVGYGTTSANCFASFTDAIVCATVPNAPASAAFTKATDTTATITWTASPGADGYMLTDGKNWSKEVTTNSCEVTVDPLSTSHSVAI